MADEDYRRLAAACACGKPVKQYSGRGAPPKHCESHSRKSAIRPKSIVFGKCECCGAVFEKRSAKSRFCNKLCYWRLRGGHEPRQDWPCSCVLCGSSYTSIDKRSIYCSNACKMTGFKRKSDPMAGMRREAQKLAAIERRLKADRAKHEKAEHKAQSKADQLIARAMLCARPCCDCGDPIGSGRGNRCAVCVPIHAQRLKAAARKRRKAAVKGASVAESVIDTRVLERDGWRCYLCGVDTPRELRGTYEPNAPEVEHMVPVSRGGEHSYANTRCACRSCNHIKGDRTLEEVGGAFEPRGGHRHPEMSLPQSTAPHLTQRKNPCREFC